MEDMRDFLLKFDFTNDRYVQYIPKQKPLGSTFAYLTIKEMSQISSDINDAAVILMTFYLRKVTHPKYDFFDDKAVAKALNWSDRKTKQVRLNLVQHGWVKKVVYTQPTTKAKMTVFYLGKEICSKVQTPEEYTATAKRREATQRPIIEHFGLTNWNEVMDKYTEQEIMDAHATIKGIK